MGTKDGKRFSKHVEFPKGDPENSFTRQDHQNKFKSMASWAGRKQGQIDKLIGTLGRFEELDTVSQLTRLLVPQ